MTTYTITTSQSLDQLSAPSGGDHTFNINGGSLTIDTDTRYNAVFSGSTGTLGNITISSTLGGSVLIDGTKVRLIPFNSGTSGNVPAIGTSISQGGVSATLLGVWATLASAPTTAGSAMPSSGFIKVKNKAGGNFAAGALTGIGASASAADVPGWIEVIGTETRTCTVPRLGSFTATGEWFTVIDTAGNPITTSGSANQTIQLPASLANTHYGGAWIETGAGTNVYEFYASAANLTTTNAATGAVRGKLVWISSQGLLRIGSDGTNTVGHVPPSGCRIRIPNIVLLNATSASPSTNAAPNSTLATRYDFTLASGTISIDKVSSAWFLTFNNAYSLSLSNASTLTQILITTTYTPISISNVVVGLSDNTQIQIAFSISNTSNGTITDVYGVSLDSATATCNFGQCSNLTLTRGKFVIANSRTGTRSNIQIGTLCSGFSLFDCTIINGRLNATTAQNVYVENLIYCDVLGGTTGTTNAINAIIISGCYGATIKGLSFAGLTNVHSYDYLISVSNSSDVVIRQIATQAGRLSLGSANISAGFVTVINSINVSIKRCFITGTPRTRFVSRSTSCFGLLLENVWADPTIFLHSGNPTNAANREITKGSYFIDSPQTIFTNFTDTIFYDTFHANTQGISGIFMNEPTSIGYGSFVTLTGTARFTATGNLYLPNAGDSCTWEDPAWILGYTNLDFLDAVLVGASGISGRVTVEYQINKNDGNGFSSWKAATATNFIGEGSFNPALGIKFRRRITATTSDTTNTISGLYFYLTTNSTDQQIQYPLFNYPISVSGLPTSANTAIRFVSGLGLLASGTSNGSGIYSDTYSTDTDYTSAPANVRIRSRKIGVLPIELTDQITSTGISAVAAFTTNPYSTVSGASVTGVSLTVSSPTVTLISISQTRAIAEVADYCFNYLVGNLADDVFLSYDGNSFAPTCDITLASGGILSGNATVVLAASKILRLNVARTYSFNASIPATGIVRVADGATSLLGFEFASGATIELLPGATAATVTVSDTTGITAGTGVTLQEPEITMRLYGIPNVTNAILYVKNLTTNAVTYPTLTGGEATIVVDPSVDYQVRADAPGYLASAFVTLSGSTPEYQFTLTDYRALYESGTNRSSQINFNYSTFVVTINDDFASYTFADVFRTMEDYLSTSNGILFPNPPFPIVLPDRNVLWFPYDDDLDIVNPVIIRPDPTNTTDPTLTNFEVYLEGAVDPVFDLFDFTSAGGRIIRVRAQVAVATGGSGGSGASALEIRQEIDTNSTQLAAIKAKTDQLTFTTANRVDSSVIDKTGFSLSSAQSFNLTGNITGNLSGSVGSVTNAITLPNIPNNWITAAGINASAFTAAKFATDAIDSNAIASSAVNKIQSGLSTYNGADTAGTTTLLSRLTSTRAANLDNLNAQVSDRPTLAQIEASTVLAKQSAVLSIPANPLLDSNYTPPNNDGIASILTNTNRVNALIENSGGDRFTAKALEAGPGSSGLTNDQDAKLTALHATLVTSGITNLLAKEATLTAIGVVVNAIDVTARNTQNLVIAGL